MIAPYLKVPHYGALPLYIPLFVLSVTCKIFIFLKLCYLRRQTLSSVPGPKWASWTRFWIIRILASGNCAEKFVDINKRYGSLARIGPKHLLTSDLALIHRILAVRSGYTRGPWFDSLRIDPHSPNVVSERNIEANFATRICGVSQEAKDIVFDNVNGERGDTGLSMESYVAMKAALSPSKECDEMNRQMIQNVAAALDGLIPSTQQSVRIRLWSWFRQNITAATTKAVYGPKNPLNDQSIVDAFWQFEDDVMAILVGVFPSITARKGIAGREIVAKAFEQYYRDDGLMTGSIFAKNRYEVAEKNGVALEDIAKWEVGGVTALVANSSPTALWTIFFIYSTPGLLDDIRREIDAVVVTNNEGHEITRSLDIKSLKEQCPLLTSTFQETLRYGSIGTSVREVMEDTILDGQWLLKKGAMVQMPSRIIHKDPSLWGPDVEEFNPQRFMKDSEAQRSGSTTRKRPSPACFRAFGGGTTLCPGRHFATNEILALTAMFVLRFDMAPLAGSTWSMPTTQNSNMSIIVVQPDTDFEVEVSRRKGFETGRFTCGLNGSDTILAVTVEDRTE